jgi:hypothetical protein
MGARLVLKPQPGESLAYYAEILASTASASRSKMDAELTFFNGAAGLPKALCCQ